MFREAATGKTPLEIARGLNSDCLGTWRSAREWSASYVRKVLTNAAAIGTFTPHRVQHVARDEGETLRRSKPLQPIANYFPKIVTRGLFDQVQAILRAHKKERPSLTTLKSSKSRMQQNVLAGLARCDLCGSLMIRVLNGSGNNRKPFLVCSAAKNRKVCVYRAIALWGIENALFELAGRRKLLEAASIQQPSTPSSMKDKGPSLHERREELLGQWRRLEARKIDLEEAKTEEQARRSSANAMVAIAEAQNAIEAKLAAVETQLQRLSTPQKLMRTAIALGEMHTHWLGKNDDATSIGRANAALRAVLSKVVIHFRPGNQGELQLHWLHGGVARLEVQ